jgi:hypothetical protein
MAGASAVVVLALAVLMLYGLLRAVASVVSTVTGARYRAYRQLASFYRGKYEHRGVSEPPTVSFYYNGSSVRVGLAPVVAGQVNPPRTRVVARFAAGLPFRLELHPQGRQVSPQLPKGTREVRTGNPDVDRQYVIQSNDPEVAASLMRTDPVRTALDHLRRLAPPTGMLVSVNPERLLVQVDRNLGASAPLLETAVRHALILHDYVRACVSAASQGSGVVIEYAGPATEVEQGPPICKVCGCSIEEAHVACASCRAPFHRDCWTFIGGCSIFGCQSKQSIPA